MSLIPTSLLYRVLQEQGIALDWHPLPDDILGMYRRSPRLRCPVIILNSRIQPDSPLYRVVLAHELGHHFTSRGGSVRVFAVGYNETNYREEWRANAWAANFLIPTVDLADAYHRGVLSSPELADYFHVTEELVTYKYRVLQSDVQERLLFQRLLNINSNNVGAKDGETRGCSCAQFDSEPLLSYF